MTKLNVQNEELSYLFVITTSPSTCKSEGYTTIGLLTTLGIGSESGTKNNPLKVTRLHSPESPCLPERSDGWCHLSFNHWLTWGWHGSCRSGRVRVKRQDQSNTIHWWINMDSNLMIGSCKVRQGCYEAERKDIASIQTMSTEVLRWRPPVFLPARCLRQTGKLDENKLKWAKILVLLMMTS